MSTEAIPEALMSIITMTDTALPPGNIGAVVGRAGVGKTSFLVQVALNNMSNGKNVLHINLADSVKKTAFWYREVFSYIVDRYALKGSVELDDLIAKRFIMTLKIGGFTVAGLQERITDLFEQNIFSPDMLVVDGLSFDEPRYETVGELKALGNAFGLSIWISVPAHRDEARDDNGMPARITEVANLFDLVWELMPDGKIIDVVPLKQASSTHDDAKLFMDPSSMLLGS